MSNSDQSQLILAVPGPEQMRSFPKTVVRAAIASGEIRRSQLIWSPFHNEWKQLRELPHLIPENTAEQQPHEEENPSVEVEPPKVVRVDERKFRPNLQSISQKKANYGHKETQDESHGFSYTSLIILVLTSILVGTLGTNYLLVDTPFRNNLTHYGLADLPIHAHLVSFYQSDFVLIHILPSPEITENKLPDLLVKIAKSTPNEALNGEFFSWVSLTSGWNAQYSVVGKAWRSYSTMNQATRNEKIKYLLNNLEDKYGNPLLSKPHMVKTEDHSPADTSPLSTANDELTDEQKKAWDRFVYSFVQ